MIRHRDGYDEPQLLIKEAIMSANHVTARRCSLRTYVDGYVQYLANKGYTRLTQRQYKTCLLRSIAYAEKNHIYSARRFCSSIDNLLLECSGSKWVHRSVRSTVNRFIEYLGQLGVVAVPQTNKPRTKYAQLTHKFTKFQIDHRGISPGYAKKVEVCCTCFFEYLQNLGIHRLAALKPETVINFITEDGNRYQRKTVSYRCSILRALLAYLYRNSLIGRDLSGVVIGPRIFRNEACPRFVSKSQMLAILSQIDRATAVGLRDYAMILLLITYGLRGIEVIRLRLEDIDWRKNLLRIRKRKAGNNTVYPLASSVARAIIRYLRKGRPHSNDRHVFLSAKIPHRRLACIQGLGNRIRQCMRMTGITIARPGTHTFRYSCAQSLLKRGIPLKVISDYLGHTGPETTQQYIKIAIDDLRDVALGDGEEAAL